MKRCNIISWYCTILHFLSENRAFVNNFSHHCCFLVGGRRFSEGTSADREIQRTLMEVGSSQELELKY